MQNLNLDDTGDWEVDKYPDSTGSGSEDVVAGTLVTLTAKVSAGGSAEVDPTVSITDKTGAAIEPEKVEYDRETNLLTVEYRVMAGSADAEGAATYNVKLSKAGCTYFELTGIPMITSIKSLDLNTFNKGKEIELLAGDANGDGKINVLDLSLAKTNFDKLLKDDPTLLGDVNSDGKISVLDLSLIKTNFDQNSDKVTYAS